MDSLNTDKSDEEYHNSFNQHGFNKSMENVLYTPAEYRALLSPGTTLDNSQRCDTVTYEDLKYIDAIAPEQTDKCGPRSTLAAMFTWSDQPPLPSTESRNWFHKTAGSCKLCAEEHYFIHRKTGKKLTSAMLNLCPMYKEASVDLRHTIID